MPEIIFTGPAGRLEGRYHPARQKNAPIAIVLHPHPQFGGTMNHQIIYQMYYQFVHRGFSVLRFNFRGVGRSQGSFDHGSGELSDSASALDWAQTINPEARSCWIAGFSFGAWIGMQLLMRRPEIEGFISIAPPANLYDFSFLAPCPSSGLIIHGDKDAVVPYKDVSGLVEKLKTQKGIIIDQKVVPGANHFFDGKIEPLMQSVSAYLDKRLKTERKPAAERQARSSPCGKSRYRSARSCQQCGDRLAARRRYRPRRRDRGCAVSVSRAPVRSPTRWPAAASVSPRCSSIIAPDQIWPIGLAMPCPAMSGAEPCTGSNTDGNLRSGLMLPRRRDADGAGAGGAEVGQDVAEQVRGDHDVEAVGLAARTALTEYRCGTCPI